MKIIAGRLGQICQQVNVFCGYRPSIIVATARIANPRNSSQKLSPPITGRAIKLPRKPSTPRITAIHHVMFFGADSLIVILLLVK